MDVPLSTAASTAAPASWPNVRLLWSYARPHRASLAAGLALALATSAVALATPLVTERLLRTAGTAEPAAGPIALLLGLLAVGAVVGLAQWALLGRVAEAAVLDARGDLVRRYLGAVVPALQRHPPGELVTRVTSDTALLREATSGSLVGLANAVVLLVGSLVLMGTIDLPLLGVAGASVLVVAVLFALCLPRMASAEQAGQAAVGRLGGELEGVLRAIRTVKAAGAEERQAERLLDDARDAARHGVRAVWAQSIGWTIAGSGIQLGIIAVLAVGAWRVEAGDLGVPALVAFLLYTFQLTGPVQELAQHASSLQSGVAAAARLRQLDALPAEASLLPTAAAAVPVTATRAAASRPTTEATAARPTAVTTTATESGTAARPTRAQDDRRPGDAAELGARARGGEGPVIELRGVSASYGDGPPVLRDVDLALPRRGHVALVGPSGAGKTTLFSLVLRFLEPCAGTLLLDGRPYAELPHAAVRRRLAYVEQEAPLVPGTVRDNAAFGHPGATDDELHRALALARLDERVAALEDGLATPVTSTAISGGERQRLALARALLRPTDVLLLDEATAQVDGVTEAAIAAAIRERAADGVVVTIAHRLSTVVDADTIILLDAGRVRAQGTHAELVATDDLYRSLVRALRIGDGPPTGDDPSVEGTPVAAGNHAG